MASQVEIIYRNILENSTITVTTENAAFPKYRLHDRGIAKLFKGTAYASPFAIKVYQEGWGYEVDRLIIPVGHNLNGLACSLRYSTDDFAADDHEANAWIQGDALLIDKKVLIPDGIEIVSNGGMETGTPPTGWQAYEAPATFERSSVQKYAGTYSAHVVANGIKGFLQVMPGLIIGHTYRLTYRWWLVSGTLRSQVDYPNHLIDLTTPTGSWQYKEATFTVTGSNPKLYFIGNEGGGEFYIDEVSLQDMTPTSLTKQYWKLNVTAPATIVELPEMFLGKTYVFVANPLWGARESWKRNILSDETRSGYDRDVEFGDERPVRAYELKDILAPQKAELEALEALCRGVKGFYIKDHNGTVIFMKLLNELDIGYDGEDSTDVYYSCRLELRGILGR